MAGIKPAIESEFVEIDISASGLTSPEPAER
jgi:hypothetical protein